MDIKNRNNIIAWLFFLLGTGFAVYTVVLVWKLTSPFPISHTKTRISIHTIVPTYVFIPDIGLETPVSQIISDSKNHNSVTENGAAYIIPTYNSENEIFYGHTYNGIFGKLPKSMPGMKVYILYSDGSKRIYTIISTQTLKTNQTGVLKPSSIPKITLYTCAGAFDRDRFVAIGSLDTL